jgi:hypothetical protein
MTKNKLPIACQEIFDDLKSHFPKKHALVILENSSEVSLRRIYGVYSGVITDPKKILEIAHLAVKIIRKNIDPSYAKGRKIVIESKKSTKLSR